MLFYALELVSEKLLLVERLDEILDDVQTLRSEMEDQAIPERELGGELHAVWIRWTTFLGKLAGL
jgi:hypothetical protein